MSVLSPNTCDDEAACVQLFKTLLKFRTVSSEGTSGSYRECAAWLHQQSEALGLKTRTVELVKNKPIVIATLQGSQPDLPSVVLNSHYDVVPAAADKWTIDPWSAVEREGRIYGRGAQDMKCVCAQYLLAIGRLLHQNQGRPLFRRNVHLTFLPDEEIGGIDGMGALLKAKDVYDSIGPIGVALDEGLANPEQGQYTVFYGERAPCWFIVTAQGPTGHGSRFIADTAVNKLIGVANKGLEFRRQQELRLGGQVREGCQHSQAKKLGDVATINLTMLQAGVSGDGGRTWALNVIPTQAEAGFDMRVPIDISLKDITAMIDDWCKEEGLSWTFTVPPVGDKHFVTSIDPTTNPWWNQFKQTCERRGMKLQTEIFPAGTDSRFLRALGVPAFGFSPMAGSPILLHEHDEYLDRAVFLKGVGIYVDLIRDLANLAETNKASKL